MRQLLEAGVHFGHQTRRWNPKMRPYIFAERNGIHIIDLAQTAKLLESSLEFVTETVARGEYVLFVGTKKQAQEPIAQEATRAGQPYVNKRWLGGMLTNFQTIRKQIRRLRELEQGAADGDFENYTKKEKLLFERERVKLSRNLEGIKHMSRLPGALFVVDAKKERIAVSEANKLGIPIVAICDTNSDPDLISVPIAGNDDAIRSVELIARAISDAITEARREAPTRPTEEEGEESTYSSDRGMEPAAGGAGGSEEERKRRRRPRRRRAKPEAIAARLKGGAEGGEAVEGGDAAGDADEGADTEA